MAVIDDSKVGDAIYVGIKTPKAVSNQDDAKMRASHAVKLTSGFWLTFLVPLLQPFQYVFFTCCMPETMGKTSGETQAWFSGEKSEPAHSQQ
ncbi:hypothetical protein KRP22_010180 [Phytophthora ramorum]|nr:hypothetical protein KRP22_5951 [Phytophthora ramorum]